MTALPLPGGEAYAQLRLVARSHLSVKAEARFWKKVDKDRADGCWQWLASTTYQGYGWFDKRMAHRVAYELLRGPIPAGMVTDHLCENKGCVNPWHLEVVTPAENVRRGPAWREAGRSNAAKTHCPSGHEYTPQNIKWNNGRRDCRACATTGVRATKRSATHCPSGHEYTPENTRMDNGHRRCRACRKELDRQRRERAVIPSDRPAVGVPPTATAGPPTQ